MLFLLPGALELAGEQLPASYVYAVATAVDHRGQGLAAELTRQSAKQAQQDGQAALCLLPADAGLYEYYGKLGFRTAFARQARSFARETAEIPYLKTNLVWDAAQVQLQRAQRWGAQGFFAWGAPMLEYMRQEQRFTGGRVRCAEGGYVFYSVENRLLTAEECCAAPEVTEWLLQKSLSISGCSRGEAYFAAASPISAEPGGMLLPLDDRAERFLAATQGRAYLGLTLE
ncbi:MAG: GNAT family N-acetyltransferase, partial [Oscillospiraceae bacterium]|jgi:hypothetical protein|nr:GNAT family N-acetyltransferase [Oscillospiraceae bacterium]